MNRAVMTAVMFLAGALAIAQMPPSMMGHSAVTSGGGVTVGNAVSGGTASRLLFSDGSGLVSTATPALGAALQLSSTLDVRSSISNGGSGQCSGYAGFAGNVCVGESMNIQYNASSTSGMQSLNLVHVGGGRAGIGFAYNGSTNNAAISTDSNDQTFWGDADTDMIFQPGNSTSVTFEDFGEVRIHRNATGGVDAGDCDADAEVGRIRRYSKDANNITLCGCQKVGGTFGWAAMITGGDCT